MSDILMLRSTFSHLKGISKKKERELWALGLTDWNSYRSQFGEQLKLFLTEHNENILSESEKALEDSNFEYFSQKLATSDYYRVALEYPDDVIFLDIETTGLSLYYDKITLVGWSKGTNFGVYIAGESDKHLRSALKTAKLLVTFNGIMFDVKFLNKHFENLVVPSIHLDLRFFAKRVQLSGGQKSIEKEIGFGRIEEVKDMLGEAAPILWHKYRRGDNKALRKLIEYNHADVEGMKAILDESIERFFEFDDIPKELQKNPEFSQKKSAIKWARKKPKNENSYKILIEDFKGSVKPLITYDDLDKIHPLDSICIVGIDLVSSEDRETGFCILKGNQATTSRVKTDKDMIEIALKSNVDLVSIDSPLSIPRGRTSYFDDDPNRSFGIMRVCERQLKKRGINSYPALIPSMQKLTQRGVELAKKFRKLGVPVIESYPGAAQDVMSIPRKQAGLEYLVDGMAEFGIEGPFVSEKVSHDELDAITSAIVGHFYWTGMFEGMGDEVEDYLIIPDLNGDADKWLGRTAIVLSGDIAAGKTTAAEFLASKGFSSTRYSKVLEDMLIEDKVEVNRSNLQKIGRRVNKNHGQRWLGNKALDLVADYNEIVVDGIRFLEDIAYMRELFGPRCFHIHVQADRDIRIDRISGKLGEDLTMDQAIKSTTESEIDKLAGVADIILPNDATKRKFYNKVSKFLGEI